MPSSLFDVTALQSFEVTQHTNPMTRLNTRITDVDWRHESNLTIASNDGVRKSSPEPDRFRRECNTSQEKRIEATLRTLTLNTPKGRTEEHLSAVSHCIALPDSGVQACCRTSCQRPILACTLFFATCGHQQCEAAHRADPTSTAGHFCAALILWQFSTRPTKPSAEPTRWANTCSALSMPSATFGQQQCEAAHRASPTSAADRPNGCDEAGRELKHWMLFHQTPLLRCLFLDAASRVFLLKIW